jgi:hypothetical protein
MTQVEEGTTKGQEITSLREEGTMKGQGAATKH